MSSHGKLTISQGSDIDTLILAPKHVTREEFFQHFPTLLEQMSPPGSIEDLVPVPDSHVPIIKLEYAGVDIDIIFSRLVMSSIPQNIDLGDNELLKGLDETDLRCVNGTRVTDEILTLVPQTKTFRLALRAVKLWAQKRAMYGNVVGFPGGVAWAMLVARVCQLYPMAAASTVVSKFFFVMKSWPWPKPVLLKPMEYDGPLNLRTWNPQVRILPNTALPLTDPVRYTPATQDISFLSLLRPTLPCARPTMLPLPRRLSSCEK